MQQLIQSIQQLDSGTHVLLGIASLLYVAAVIPILFAIALVFVPSRALRFIGLMTLTLPAIAIAAVFAFAAATHPAPRTSHWNTTTLFCCAYWAWYLPREKGPTRRGNRKPPNK
ncbi:MAG TPA: hypothetical protein VD997_09025 [Phycisphaerales bacterium]|nr:hypothetical protein [Phycisphaerales bacterium]